MNEIKLDPLLIKMYNCGLVSNYDRQHIDAERIPLKRAQHIFHEVLMRSPYEDLSKIRRLLIETGEPANIELAKRFPRRGENIDFTPPPFSTPANEAVAQQCTDTKSGDPEFELGIAMEPMDVEFSSSAGPFSKKNKKPDLERIRTYYQVRPGNQDSATGKGLCVVIRNYSRDLVGYSNDAILIRTFFTNYLRYEVMEGSCNDYHLVNLNYVQFEFSLNQIVKKLESGDYDRFFLFVLSHGDDKGIKMNANGVGDYKDEEEQKYPVDRIVSKFDHFNLPNMKCFPKCFFIQACRGTKPAKSAADPSGPPQPPKPMPHPECITTRAVGADLLVCFPSQMGYLSWVPNSGSWFVQETIAVLRKYYETEHLMHMMVEVADKISCRTGLGEVKAEVEAAEGGNLAEGVQEESMGSCATESVYQMPHYVCTLTRKLYLQLPPK